MCEPGDKKKNEGLGTPADIERFDDIPYGADPIWNVLDVYRPKEIPGPLPTIIDVHGGGWVYGDKEVYQFYCMSLAQQGFVVVNFSYRLAPKDTFPAAMQDMNAVVEHTLANADRYGADTSRVFLVGDSAGAHMAAMYACLCTNPSYPSCVGVTPPAGFVPTALALNCGIYDMQELMAGKGPLLSFLKPMVKDLLGTRRPSEEQLDVLSPVHYVTPAFPPAYVMTATGDFLIGQPDYLLPVLEANGIAHEFKIYGTQENKLPHVFHCNLRLAEAAQCNREEMDFFKTYC